MVIASCLHREGRRFEPGPGYLLALVNLLRDVTLSALKDKFGVVGVGTGRKAGCDADEAGVVADVVSRSRVVARNVERGARPVVVTRVIIARAGAPLWGGRRGGETFRFGRVVKVAVVEGALRGENVDVVFAVRDEMTERFLSRQTVKFTKMSEINLE